VNEIVAFDIDGVLADCSKRLPYLAQTPKDFETFYSRVNEDAVYGVGKSLAIALARESKILYLTARNNVCEQATRDWLTRKGLPVGVLAMRGRNDYRPSSVLKPEVLARYGGPQVVMLMVEDDPQVCEALSSAGYNVLRAMWGRGLEMGHDAAFNSLGLSRSQGELDGMPTS
jgi:hypothetical protein